MRGHFRCLRPHATLDSVERNVQAPIARDEHNESSRQAGWDAGKGPLYSRKEMYLARVIGSDRDDDRHDQGMPDQVDPSERVDRGVEDDEERKGG